MAFILNKRPAPLPAPAVSAHWCFPSLLPLLFLCVSPLILSPFSLLHSSRPSAPAASFPHWPFLHHWSWIVTFWLEMQCPSEVNHRLQWSPYYFFQTAWMLRHTSLLHFNNITSKAMRTTNAPLSYLPNPLIKTTRFMSKQSSVSDIKSEHS